MHSGVRWFLFILYVMSRLCRSMRVWGDCVNFSTLAWQPYQLYLFKLPSAASQETEIIILFTKFPMSFMIEGFRLLCDFVSRV